MNNKDFYKYGEAILNSINRAAESGDFSNLSKDVKSFVNDATNGFKKSGYSGPKYKKAEYREVERTVEPGNLGYDLGEELRDSIESTIRNFLPKKKDTRTPYFAVKVNRSKGIGKLVAGSFITMYGVLGVLSSLAILPIMSAEHPTMLISFVTVEALSLAAGIGLLIAGKNNRTLLKNYFNFGKIVGNRSYVELRELEDKTGIARDKIIRQIRKMRRRGYLPYASIDEAQTTLMLTDEVYQQYSRSVEYNKERAHENPKADKKDENQKVKYYTIDENLPEDVKGILEEGNEYLNKIRYYNDLIPDTEPMSDKLYTLEATVLSIFKKLKDEPEVAGDLRKFMAYYLPTTEKLLQSYVDLRKQNIDVENIRKSQREIEEATDVINDAFVKFLNQLFESSAWDISSDISVMKTMMKQDSLI
ncbi:5-bromo-4-chloroindolyl phosphate hydrolysis protein [Pseudobutyrivibrio sp. ACV-2]|uniref:5-bromo-4-chloroindolyl phosphate hydrolysis family protein n=1 Tax=Pseudobutyrivibrio sp. ACV-2 TaxID=1520801 RepID=UPI00089BACA7|nr:5-bromo-4-chloroindolyl phosphate hydrolysis family protein [Pseudobutyrivibrio sp. ACV-2]SEA85110.1 5-bromo-4-chloroindolyl phosphate hydrolysis protein [Pseudobutyrivibrio sp. ACV-2]